MELYKKSNYDVQRYIRYPNINFGYEHPAPFSFFQDLKDIYENIKVEVQAK